MILLGELPDLEDTASGKDLIHIGERRAHGRRQSWLFLPRATGRSRRRSRRKSRYSARPMRNA